MLAKRIRTILVDIAQKAYPDVKHLYFQLEFQNRELKSKYGDWRLKSPTKAEIRIFRLSENTKFILKVCIHELAHNTEHSIYKDTGHSKRFYEVYKKLLETSFKMGFLSYKDVKGTKDVEQIQKYHKFISQPKVVECARETSIIKVKNAFDIKEQLKPRGYGYNQIERTWDIEVKSESLSEELHFLENIISKDNLVVTKCFDAEIEAVGYISVGKSFEYKEQLKALGYRYNGYGIISNKWVKKIIMNNKKNELKEIESMKNIEVKILS